MDADRPERARIIDYICAGCGHIERRIVAADVRVDDAAPFRVCSANGANSAGDGRGDPDWCRFISDIVDWSPEPEDAR